MDRESIKLKVQTMLSEKRFEHCIRVAETAETLAKKHSIGSEKVYIAGLLHDIAREGQEEELNKLITENNIQLREDEINCTGIWHAFAGSLIAQKEFGITDSEILGAIRYHSMGDKGMGPVAKIIYIADIIEPERNETGDNIKFLERIREVAQDNIDKALLIAVSLRIRISLERGTIILSRGVDLWNELVSNGKKL